MTEMQSTIERAGSLVKRARRVDPSFRFLWASARKSPTPVTHRLRGSSVRVAMRHASTDVEMFHEIFCGQVYAPPTDVVARLRAAPGDQLRVLDLGANVGLFAAWITHRCARAAITAVEPDPLNLDVLRRVSAANAGARWEIIEAAASTTAGRMAFIGGLGSESHAANDAESGAFEVDTVDALPLLARSDFAKIDIEGGEWELLADPRLRDSPVTALVLEHHGRGCPTRDPRATAIELLRSAGFVTWAPGVHHLGLGTLWAWRP